MKKLLLHICCAPCLIVPLKKTNSIFQLTTFWYNGNIHPYMEYRKRLDSVREFVSQEKVDYIEEDYYGLVDFTKKTAFNVENRCYHCYNDRLEKSALVAKDKNHDCFSTSLLFSKHQNHDLLKEIGLAIAQKHQIEFYYIDFREYWDEQFLSDKRNHMYRQKYCGCIYSEWERYRGVMSCEL